jgi:hypothetical protein
MKQKRPSKQLVRLAILVCLVFPACFGDSFAAQKKGQRKPPLVKKSAVKVIELRNLEQLKEAFQRDTGKVRLLTILSPT